jgi:DNA-binding LytR/AlgR family response regulator
VSPLSNASLRPDYHRRFFLQAALLASAGWIFTVGQVAAQRIARGLPLHIHGSVYAAELIAWSLWALLSPAIAIVARRLESFPLPKRFALHAVAVTSFIALHAALHIFVRLGLRGDFPELARFPRLVWFRMMISVGQEVLFYAAIVGLVHWTRRTLEPHATTTAMPAPERETPSLDLPASPVPLTHIPVRKDAATLFVPIADIDWLEAERNYVRIHVGGQSHLVRETLSSLTARLESRGFVRVHRSAAVNLERIREFRPLFHGDGELVLQSGEVVPVGRRWRPNLNPLLGARP